MFQIVPSFVSPLSHYRVLGGAWALVVLLVGCGGGGGNDGTPALAAPTLVDAADQSYLVGSAISDLVFTNSGGGSLSGCSVDPALPAGLSVERTSNNNTCRLTGTPTVVTAQATYTVTATNATDSDDASVGITVDPPAPSLADADAQTYIAGTTITDLVFINGGGGLLTGCTVDPALPVGLDIERTSDNSTCQLTGTPTAITVQANYTVTATNATESDDATVTITVNPVAPSLANADAQTYITITANTDYYYLIAECTALGCVDPSATGPVPIASVSDTVEFKLAGASDITTTVIGDKTYALVAAKEDNGVQIIDVSDPINPDPIAKLSDGERGLELEAPQFVTATTIGEKTYTLVTALTKCPKYQGKTPTQEKRHP